jgi:hypothetical protein
LQARGVNAVGNVGEEQTDSMEGKKRMGKAVMRGLEGKEREEV